MKRGDELEITINDFAYKGQGIAFLEGRFPVFVKRALPGSKLRVRVTKAKRRFAEATVLEELAPAPNAREPLCPHVKLCGGCTFQTLPYQAQTELKFKFVKDALERIGGLENVVEKLHPLVQASAETGYRTKMEYSFGVDRFYDDATFAAKKEEGSLDDGFYLGLHTPGSFSKVEHITFCALQDNLGNILRNYVWEWAKNSGHSCYNQRTHEGVFRHLIIRFGSNTKEVHCNLVCADLPDPVATLAPLIKELVRLCEDNSHQLTSMVYTNNNGLNDVAYDKEMMVVHGQQHFLERLGHVTYKISPFSFFQVNTEMAEKLYTHVAKLVEGAQGTVLDLYCGTGSIGLFIARQVAHVIGIERDASSVRDAIENATLNNCENIEFICGNVEHVVGTEQCPVEEVDTVIVDPPREGLHPDVVKYLGELAVPRLVYVSCNPTTLARDIKGLGEFGYIVDSITLFDLFPQTYHVETVVHLTRTPR